MAQPRTDGSPSTTLNKQRLTQLRRQEPEATERAYTAGVTSAGFQRGQPSEAPAAWKRSIPTNGRPRWLLPLPTQPRLAGRCEQAG